MMKHLLASLVALGGLGIGSLAASATPTLPKSAPASATPIVEQVNHRCDGPRLRNGYCPNPHPHYNYRYAPRHRYDRYGYYPRRQSGVTLHFGTAPRYRYYRYY